MLLAIVGEYVYQIFIIVRQTPIVVEKERINFETGEMTNDVRIRYPGRSLPL